MTPMTLYDLALGEKDLRHVIAVFCVLGAMTFPPVWAVRFVLRFSAGFLEIRK